MESDSGGAERFRIVIIGAGFAGLGMAIRLKQAGIDDFVILERADDVGGTWRDNSYPGLRRRRAVPPLLVLLRPQPQLDAGLQPAGRDLGLHQAGQRGARRAAPRPVRPRGDRRRVERVDAAVGGAHHRRHVRRPVRHLGDGPAVQPDPARHPGARDLYRPLLPLRPVGPRPRPHRRSGSPSSGRARRPPSSSPRSSRRWGSCSSSSAPRAGPSPGRTATSPTWSGRSTGDSRWRSGRCGPGSTSTGSWSASWCSTPA